MTNISCSIPPILPRSRLQTKLSSIRGGTSHEEGTVAEEQDESHYGDVSFGEDHG